MYYKCLIHKMRILQFIIAFVNLTFKNLSHRPVSATCIYIFHYTRLAVNSEISEAI